MLKWVAAAVLTLAVFAGGAAPTAAATDRDLCYSINSDDFKRDGYINTGIAACTRIIDAQRGGNSVTLAAAYITRAYWLHRNRNHDASMKDYNRGLELNPNSYEGYDYRADLWADLGNPGRALCDYQQAILLNPQYAAARYSRGEIYNKHGDFDRARAEYQKAIELPAVDRIAEWAQNNARKRLRALGGKRTTGTVADIQNQCQEIVSLETASTPRG
jgi:tetratricopeptide (TPR) repeat protein